MSPATSDRGSTERSEHAKREYVVIARRYRPQSFEELIGQQQVARALTNAIGTNRVGHAYLFTGARGVGKTSTARILAKALNCVQGPTARPCQVCDICRSVAGGEDVDVLEIDGASNRGIDEIRQLRSNVNIRPSRARFKIYIIDEVHMLTMPAFNALLKTLEEPPEHVKFIFCTTDPEKVPITVLSRCQRFDFAPVETSSIVDRLRHIVSSEGVEAEEEALQLLARRAGGSLRDSQSLLEQLLSFSGERITAQDVHRLLGTAASGRMAEIVSHLIGKDAAASLRAVDRAAAEGVDVGQLAEQLLGYFRDMMAAVVGCQPDLLLHTMAADHAVVLEAARCMGLETILAVTQILDQCLTRMRQSTHVRTLLEIALVRISRLESLDELRDLIEQLRQETPAGDHGSSPPRAPVPAAAERPLSASASVSASASAASAQKKTPELTEARVPEPALPAPSELLTAASAERVWKQALAQLGDMTADHGARYERVAMAGPDQLVVSFREAFTLDKERCERPDRKSRIEEALLRTTGRPTRVAFETVAEPAADAASRKVPVTRWEKRQQQRNNPLVRQAMELFDAELTDFEEPRQPPGVSVLRRGNGSGPPDAQQGSG